MRQLLMVAVARKPSRRLVAPPLTLASLGRSSYLPESGSALTPDLITIEERASSAKAQELGTLFAL